VTEVKLNVYISTCDKHIHLIKGHQYLFNKFWPDHPTVKVMGYKKPDFKLKSNYEFVSLGIDRGPEYWGTDLRNYFQSIEDTHFIYGMDDHWIPTKVNSEIINTLTEYCIDEKVGRISLTDDLQQFQYSMYDSNNGITIIRKKEFFAGETYHITAQYSIWNKKWMLKYLLDGMSPWEFELNGSVAAMADGYKVLGTLDTYAMKNMQVVVRGDLINLNFEWVNERHKSLDIDIVKDMKKKKII